MTSCLQKQKQKKKKKKTIHGPNPTNLTNNRRIDDRLNTSLSANTNMVTCILTNHVQRTRLITSSTGKHYSLDSEDDFLSGCRNVSHQQQFFSELLSPGRSHYTIANCFASLRSNYQNLPIAIAEILPAFRCRKVFSLCVLLSTGTSLPP